MKTAKPIRIQRSRQHKQVSPNGFPIVYVGRPSKWGNPIKIGMILKATGIPDKKMDTIEDVIEAYKWWLRQTNDGLHIRFIARNELKGKNLSCWCKIGEPCHADILLQIANL